MTQRMTDELADAMAQVVADTFSDGFLEIYSGTAGATPDDISGGTLLCEILLPAVAFAVASGAVFARAFGLSYARSLRAALRVCNLYLTGPRYGTQADYPVHGGRVCGAD